MKENIYDTDHFFEQYSHFPRSVNGLKSAGEWHAFKNMLPDMQNKRVLDIGCGFGWHCIYAAANGASAVTGTDISEKMLAVARAKTTAPTVSYLRQAMEDLTFESNSFDIVLSSLAFHYTPDFMAVCQKIRSFLTPGGTFVFSVEHPVFTASGKQDWLYDKAGHKLCWPVDRYFFEGARKAVFLETEVIKYHRTLTSYLNTLLQLGFTLTHVEEPEPAEHMLDAIPGMRDELRRPMMLLISALYGKNLTQEYPERPL